MNGEFFYAAMFQLACSLAGDVFGQRTTVAAQLPTARRRKGTGLAETNSLLKAKLHSLWAIPSRRALIKLVNMLNMLMFKPTPQKLYRSLPLVW